VISVPSVPCMWWGRNKSLISVSCPGRAFACLLDDLLDLI